jgi:hypothetical protein
MNWKPFLIAAETPYNGHWRCCLLLASRNGDIPTNATHLVTAAKAALWLTKSFMRVVARATFMCVPFPESMSAAVVFAAVSTRC